VALIASALGGCVADESVLELTLASDCSATADGGSADGGSGASGDASSAAGSQVMVTLTRTDDGEKAQLTYPLKGHAASATLTATVPGTAEHSTVDVSVTIVDTSGNPVLAGKTSVGLDPGTLATARVCLAAPSGDRRMNCGTGIVDLDTDASNCGGCGRVCGGGESIDPAPQCTGGLCTPMQLIGDQPEPRALVVTASSIYFGNSGTPGDVNRIDRTTGLYEKLADGLSNLRDLAVDPAETRLYYPTKDDGNVTELTISTKAIRVLAMQQMAPRAVALLGDSLYWVNEATDDLTGSVWSVNLTSGSAASLSGMRNHPRGITSDGTFIYFVDQGSQNRVMPDGVVYELTPGGAGGGVTQLVTGQDNPAAIAVHQGTLYWTNAGSKDTADGTVMMFALAAGAGGSATRIAQGQAVPSNILADDTGIYWLNEGLTATDGQLVKLSAPGAAPQVLADQQEHPLGMARQGDRVFWSTEGTGNGGSIYSLTTDGL
jgi:hypothetical protein